MRKFGWVIAAATLFGCAADPLCGFDDDGNEIPICTYAADGLALPMEFCPGDSWGAADGCNSCACDSDGNILCTSICTTPE